MTGGGSEITADDITPELLENRDIYHKIQNWGLSDEEVSELPVITGIEDSFQSGVTGEEDLLATAEFIEFTFDGLSLNSQNNQDRQFFDTLDDPYIVYKSSEDSGYIVLKKVSRSSNHYEDFSGTLVIGLNYGNCYISVGVDTY